MNSKSFLYRIIMISVCIQFCVYFSVNALTPVEKYGHLQVIGTQLCDQYGNAIQLKVPSSGWLQWDQGIANAANLEWLVDNWNISVFGIAPGTENGGFLENPASYKTRVVELKDAAINLGIYVIIDWHGRNANQHVTESQAFFTEMAQTYGNSPNVLYETFNEPVDGNWNDNYRPYHVSLINTIRGYIHNINCG